MSHGWVSVERLERARSHLDSCNLCEHRCRASRARGERGPCKAGATARVFRHRVEYGEELELVPSHLFYLSGCDLRCTFCIAGLNAFDPSRGWELTSDAFNDCVRWGRAQGARNLQWVGGEPTLHVPAILDVMSQCPDLPPIVWKSDFHGTPDAFELLEGVVDTYVADFKFGNDRCAQQLAGVKNYVQVVTRNLKLACAQTRLIVRHLLLPGHSECCYRPIAGWLADELPEAAFSIRDSYLPSWRARGSEMLGRPLEPCEGEAARELATRIGLTVIQ
jgi:putative pyruvate formate lyase activating enzyme